MEQIRKPWIPFDAAEDEAVSLRVLRDVDTHTKIELVRWVYDFFENRDISGYPNGRVGDLRTAQLTLRVDLGIGTGWTDYLNWQLVHKRISELQASSLLRVVDFLLSRPSMDARAAKGVADILQVANSKYAVTKSEERWRLSYVVPEATAVALELAVGSAGDHLRSAFNHAYAVEPNPSSAYESAMKALEAAAGPVVKPGSRLGGKISDLSNGGAVIDLLLSKSGKSVPLAGEMAWNDQAYLNTPGALRDLMRALSLGQTDRHPDDPNYAPISVEQARTAVLLVTALVPLFQGGLIQNVTPPKAFKRGDKVGVKAPDIRAAAGAGSTPRRPHPGSAAASPPSIPS